MSGAKRRTKYRKQVQLDVLDSFPEPAEDEAIVEMVASRGGNLLEVRTPQGNLELCRLPAKFRKVIWVKRGTFMIAKGGTGDYQTASGELGKVKWTVAFVLFTQQVKHLQRIGKWPDIFQPQPATLQTATKDTDEPIKQLESSLEASTITTGEQQEQETAAEEEEEEEEDDDEDDGEYYASTDDESDLFQNQNRRGPVVLSDDSSDDDEE